MADFIFVFGFLSTTNLYSFQYPQTYEVLMRKSLTAKYLDLTGVHFSG